MLSVSGILVLMGWIYDSYLCFANDNSCPFDAVRLTVFEPLVLSTLPLLVVSPFLFFISDAVFLKWLRFAVVWFGVTAIFVIMAPVYTGGFMGFGPTKEGVSIWMGILFVVVSLIRILLAYRKSKSGDEKMKNI